MKKSSIGFEDRAWRRAINRDEEKIGKRLANVIILTVPMMVMCFAINIVMRISDFYSFCLNSTGIMSSTTIKTTQEDVVSTIARLMQGRSDALDLMENDGYDPQPIFSALDSSAMLAARSILNMLLVIGVLALIITAVMYLILIRMRIKDPFMKRFKISIMVFIAFEAINMAVVMSGSLRRHVFGKFVPMKFPDGDNLVLLLGEHFPRQAALFELGAGIILMSVVGYATWYVAGRRKMFGGF